MKWLGSKTLTGSEALAGIEALTRRLWISINSAGQGERLKSYNFRLKLSCGLDRSRE